MSLTHALYGPVRSEATISRLHVRHQNASTFDVQTYAREKNKREIVEQQLSGAFPKMVSFSPTLSFLIKQCKHTVQL